MFNRLNIATGVILLSSVVLSTEQANAIVYSFENFNPGNGPISASGTITVVDLSNDGIVDFSNELTDWDITLNNSLNFDSSVLTKANSVVNRVIDIDTGLELPYLTGVTVTPSLVDFGNADNILPGGFSLESTDSLLSDRLIITTATNLNPILNISTQISTETLILTSDLPLNADTIADDVPLNSGVDTQSTATVGGPPTFQATADGTAVPFEFSPSLGLITIGFAWGFSKYKKMQLSKK